MEKVLEITKINLIINRNLRCYVLFNINQSPYDYLYFSNVKKDNKALFYGKDFTDTILNIINKSSKDCIECNLGISMLGGVSLDQGEQVENEITSLEANKIIDKLREYLNETELFVNTF